MVTAFILLNLSTAFLSPHTIQTVVTLVLQEVGGDIIVTEKSFCCYASLVREPRVSSSNPDAINGNSGYRSWEEMDATNHFYFGVAVADKVYLNYGFTLV